MRGRFCLRAFDGMALPGTTAAKRRSAKGTDARGVTRVRPHHLSLAMTACWFFVVQLFPGMRVHMYILFSGFAGFIHTGCTSDIPFLSHGHWKMKPVYTRSSIHPSRRVVLRVFIFGVCNHAHARSTRTRCLHSLRPPTMPHPSCICMQVTPQTVVT